MDLYAITETAKKVFTMIQRKYLAQNAVKNAKNVKDQNLMIVLVNIVPIHLSK